MPLNEIIGRFYFKQTNTGNLVCEFSNIQTPGLYDICNFSPNSDIKSPFLGKFDSTWYVDGKPVYAKLTITHRPHSKPRIYLVKWKIIGKHKFGGEGTIWNDTLIGEYQFIVKRSPNRIPQE